MNRRSLPSGSFGVAHTTAAVLAAVAGLALPMLPAAALAQPQTQTTTALSQPAAGDPSLATVGELSNKVWAAARSDNAEGVLDLLRHLPGAGLPTGGVADGATPELTKLRDSFAALDANIAKRDTARAAKIAEIDGKLNDKIADHAAAADAEAAGEALSEAIKFAVERFIVSVDQAGFKHDPRVTGLIAKGEEAAKAAEARGDWFTANEIFFRLSLLLEEEGTYKADVERLGRRLGMIRLYVPEEFWRLRNQERLKADKSPLPPYNGLGEDFRDKLKGVDAQMVFNSIVASARQQVEKVPLRQMIAGAVDALRTMITTRDLEKVFPALGNGPARQGMLAFLDRWDEKIERDALVSNQTLEDFLDELSDVNRQTVAIPGPALLHEIGNGAMGRLDDFSAIIWPDELARFNRMTEGEFRGVGIQIQMDDETQMIKVVTPLEGTPAQRAGIKAGDYIKKIDGKSAVGITLPQAVDLITGPAESRVTVTVERDTGEDDADGRDISEDIDFPLLRAVIPMQTVKGWRRLGAKEDQWDWFIDRDAGIGYVRLLQFTDNTTSDLRAAIRQMKARDGAAGAGGGLKGLILDLRFNPGGLLTEAVSVSNAFIDRGVIVSTEGTVQGEVKSAVRGDSLLQCIPVAVLINEGSASASEIVSGAIRHYADKGELDAVLVGKRTFGKGSVQNVWQPARNYKIKLTTQYYKLPDGRVIHRKPGASTWGVDPHLTVDMLPEVVSDALELRQNADVLPIDAQGNIVEGAAGEARPNPDTLLTDGLDLQLQTALLLLQTKTVAQTQAHVRLDHPEPTTVAR